MENLLWSIFDHYWRIIFLSFIGTPDDEKVNRLNDEFLATCDTSRKHSALYYAFNKWQHIQYLKQNGIKIKKYIPDPNYDIEEFD